MGNDELVAAYETAYQRAQGLGLRVMGEVDAVDGAHYWLVNSGSGGPDADWHRVWIAGGRFNCTCEAATKRNRICGHKAMARAAYVAEQQALDREEQRQRDRAAQPRQRRLVAVEYEPRPRRKSRCDRCGGELFAGEVIYLDQGAVYHKGCVDTEPTSAAPGADAPRADALPDMSWNK